MPDRSVDLFASSMENPAKPQVFSVTELNRVVRGLLEAALEEVWVEGEISNFRQQASGHQYFTLKDADCQVSCVKFARPGLWKKGIALQDGMLVQVRGRLTVYEARGQYQINVSAVQPAGAGLLQAKFEALKRKLDAEGLFDPERKRALPRFPRALGIVTSPSGAALRDMLNILERRAPWLRVIVSPARVQGDGAAAEILSALEDLQDLTARGVAPIDVIVLARGGGSMEDLWEFNDERLARAIAASPIPVVSAVGHEIDFTIADFVADLRAPTPSAAAEIVAPDSTDLIRLLQQRGAFLHRHATNTLTQARRHLDALSRSALFREPRLRLEQLAQRVDSTEQALAHALREHLAQLRQHLDRVHAELRQHRPDRHLAILRERITPLEARLREVFQRQQRIRTDRVAHLAEMLRLLSPDRTLQRGYSLTTDAEGKLLRSAASAPPGTVLHTRLPDGTLTSIVQGDGAIPPAPPTPRKRTRKVDTDSHPPLL